MSGPLKPGDVVTVTEEHQMLGDWHLGCEVIFEYVNNDGIMSFWCRKHNQWLYTQPHSKTYHYHGFADLRR